MEIARETMMILDTFDPEVRRLVKITDLSYEDTLQLALHPKEVQLQALRRVIQQERLLGSNPRLNPLYGPSSEENGSSISGSTLPKKTAG